MGQRIGMGYDSHRFGADRPLVLGGVTVPADSGLVGHSDADAVAHAVIDALLGAAALGDIGQLFPDTDPAWRDADSMRLLREVADRIRTAGYRAVNVDVTVVTEAPKLAPHTVAMRRRLAQEIGLDPGAVSVKAKTSEAMGPIGRGEGLVVYAVALLEDG